MGSGGGAVNSSSQTSSASNPAPWLEGLSEGLGGTVGNSYSIANGQANQIGANASNWANQAGNSMNSAANSFGNANNTASSAANLANASAQYNPEIMQSQYMNPYTQNVVQQNADIAQRNFNQQTIPSLQAAMGASGQYGSTRADNAMGLASANMAGNLAQTNASLMNQGYQQEQNAYQNTMGIGVNAANAMNQSGQVQSGVGTGQVNAGNGLFNMASGANALSGNNFAKYSGGLSYLPHSTNTSNQSNTTTPVQSSGFF